MRHFKTILLWLAFILLLSQVWIDNQSNVIIGFAYRLAPSLCLLIWFFLALLFKQTLKINAIEIPKCALLSLKILRPLSSGLIILGALFKLMHWPWGSLFLTLGIGFMALYSTVLNQYSYLQGEQNPNIIDDLRK